MADALAAKLQASARGMQTRIQNRRASTPAIMQKTQERPNANAGNAIRVRVRVRPLGDGRGALREKLQVDKQRGVITIGDQGQGGSSQSSSTFAFDTVYESEDNQAVFEHVGRPIIENLMLGFNGTLFAYGQTGSGKTFTIGEISQLGTACEGVAHRMIRALFSPPTGEAAGSKPTSCACPSLLSHHHTLLASYTHQPTQSQHRAHAHPCYAPCFIHPRATAPGTPPNTAPELDLLHLRAHPQVCGAICANLR